MRLAWMIASRRRGRLAQVSRAFCGGRLYGARAARLFAKQAVMLYSPQFAGRPVSTTLPAVSCRIIRAQERIGGEGHEGQLITH